MKRVAAHKITHSGKCHTMCMASLSPDGQSIDIAPLTREVHSTLFVNGHIEVFIHNGQLTFRKLN